VYQAAKQLKIMTLCRHVGFLFAWCFVAGYSFTPNSRLLSTPFTASARQSRVQRLMFVDFGAAVDQATTAIQTCLIVCLPTTRMAGDNVDTINNVMVDTTTTATASSMALSKTTAVGVFIVGLIPFVVATVEFWRRVAVGASFGTSTTERIVIIGQKDQPLSSRGERVLGKDALLTAYLLFGIAAAVLGIVLFAVVTSPEQQ
jgi:hypothetical protein